MGKALFDKTSELFTGKFSRGSSISHDPGTQIEIEVDVSPSVRIDRWDGATGIRVATQQELDDFDAADLDRVSTNTLNTPLNKTLLDLFQDFEQRLQAAGQTSTIPSIAAATNPAEYKTALKKILESYN